MAAHGSHAGRVKRQIAALFLLAMIVTGFSAYLVRSVETPIVQAAPACAAKLFSTYNPKDLNQCVAVCMSCNGGVRTTCTTACTLRGAR